VGRRHRCSLCKGPFASAYALGAEATKYVPLWPVREQRHVQPNVMFGVRGAWCATHHTKRSTLFQPPTIDFFPLPAVLLSFYRHLIVYDGGSALPLDSSDSQWFHSPSRTAHCTPRHPSLFSQFR